jgi:hypothetical protein
MFVVDILALFMRNVRGLYLHRMRTCSGSVFIAIEMKMKGRQYSHSQIVQKFYLNKRYTFFTLIEKRKANWIGHILRVYCVLEHFVQGKSDGRTAVTERRGIRRNQLLDDRKETSGHWRLKRETLDHTV